MSVVVTVPAESDVFHPISPADEPFLKGLRQELFEKISKANQVKRIHADDAKIWSDVNTMLSAEYERYKIKMIERDTGLILRGKRLLEIGSGMGFFLVVARSQGIDAVGTEPYSDFYEEDHRIGRKLQDYFGLGPGALVNDPAESLRFPDASFDVVSSYYVFEHVADPFRTLQECLRVLKPGGYLHFVFPNYGSFWEGHYALPWIPNLNRAWGSRYISWIWRRSPIMVQGINLLNERGVLNMIERLGRKADLITLGRDVFRQELLQLSFDRTGSIQRVEWIFKFLKATGLLKLFVRLLLRWNLYTPFYMTIRKC